MARIAEAPDIHQAIKETVGSPFTQKPKISTRNVDVFYDDKQAIFDVSLDIGNHDFRNGNTQNRGGY